MNTQNISLVVAHDLNLGIGKDGQLPWHIPEDMSHFRKVTTGGVVIMGRKTWESIPIKYRPLPDRENIIITRNREYNAWGGTVANSLEEAVDIGSRAKKPIYIIGGSEIYKQSIDVCNHLYITLVKHTFECDKMMEGYSELFTLVESKEVETKSGVQLEFQTWGRNEG